MTPLSYATSEVGNGAWGERSRNLSANPESVPESSSLSVPPEGLDAPFPSPNPRPDSSPIPLVHPTALCASKMEGSSRASSKRLSIFSLCLFVPLPGIIGLLIIYFINWSSVHNVVPDYNSLFLLSQDHSLAPEYDEAGSGIEFITVACVARSNPRYLIEPNSFSHPSLQAELDKITRDLNSIPISENLGYIRVGMKDLSQRTRYSTLPNKAPLVEKLSLISSTVKKLGRNFQRLSSHVRGMRNQIAEMDQYIQGEVKHGQARSIDDGPNRPAPPLKSEASELFREVVARASDLRELQTQLNIATGMELQLEVECAQERVKDKSFASLTYIWVDKNNKGAENCKLLGEIRAELERALVQVEVQQSLIYQVSNDLHIFHDQLSASTPHGTEHEFQ